MLSVTQKQPVRIVDPADRADRAQDPPKNRAIYIAGCIVLGMALGLALVCFLEHIDHSVKVPEHLTAGLGLPIFGVVPRMRRLSRNHRGGHLWTPGEPLSVEADAYRNLRASLLGATQTSKPIVTLLVTSAKAGEGKSTTALNLAATCARAGERTLLMDVDLRRPSLNDVFHRHEDGPGWSTSSGATSPGSGRSCRPTCPTSTSWPPARPATSRSRSWGAESSASS